MLYIKLNNDCEVEFSNEEINRDKLCGYDLLIDLVCEGMNLDNGMYFVNEGVCIVSGECGENIDLIKI